jgi:3-oxoadipate enol-lactonase
MTRAAEVRVDGCRLAYAVDGPEGAPAVLLLNSLGTTMEMWDPQRDAFARAWRVIRCDTRGHGRSDAPPGPYTLDQLGRDALAVLDAAGADRAHVCGISMGGMMAMWLGLHAPGRVGRLVLANTGARVGTAEGWADRMARVRASGMETVADAVLGRFFTEAFRERHPDTTARFRATLAACPPEGYAACCEALRDADLREDVNRIDAATLVVTGTDDAATPPASAEFLRERIPGARLVTLDAAHLSNVERAEAFNAAVLDFLAN